MNHDVQWNLETRGTPVDINYQTNSGSKKYAKRFSRHGDGAMPNGISGPCLSTSFPMGK